MRSSDFQPAADGPLAFIWALQNMHPNTPVTAGQCRDNASHLSREWAQLLAYAAEVEAERDKWQTIATKLIDSLDVPAGAR